MIKHSRQNICLMKIRQIGLEWKTLIIQFIVSPSIIDGSRAAFGGGGSEDFFNRRTSIFLLIFPKIPENFPIFERKLENFPNWWIFLVYGTLNSMKNYIFSQFLPFWQVGGSLSPWVRHCLQIRGLTDNQCEISQRSYIHPERIFFLYLWVKIK